MDALLVFMDVDGQNVKLEVIILREYILLDIQSYSLKKKDEYDKYKLKEFQMDDHLSVGKDVELIFKNDKIKAKFESIIKEDDTNKIFCFSTNKFTSLIQVKKYYKNVTND